jgi:hypothetical protein
VEPVQVGLVGEGVRVDLYAVGVLDLDDRERVSVAVVGLVLAVILMIVRGLPFPS